MTNLCARPLVPMRWLCVASALCAASIATAGNDPTAPPAGLTSEGEAPVRAAARAASGASAAKAATVAAPHVESVRTGGDQPATALIDGRMVRIGDRMGDAVVTAIDDQGVTLRAGKGPARWLAFAPGIRKTPSAGGDGNDDTHRTAVAVAVRHKDSQ